jgi:hypothetical protein
MSNLIGVPRAGTASLSIDGVPYDITNTAYFANVVKRETLKGQNAIHGFKEMPEAPYISGTIRDAATLSLAALNAMRNVTVTLTLANGKTVSGDGMWSTDLEEVETEEGTFKVKFEGYTVEESI